jgi:hypothetical protein
MFSTLSMDNSKDNMAFEVVCPDSPPRVLGQTGTDDTLFDIPTRILLQSTWS